MAASIECSFTFSFVTQGIPGERGEKGDSGERGLVVSSLS